MLNILERRGRSKKYKNGPDINMMPFMDICLVLLIVFISVAPSAMSGIDVSIPNSNQEKSVSRLAALNPVTVTYSNNGHLFVNDIKVMPNHLLQEIKKHTGNKNTVPIFIRSDRKNTYGNVVMLIEEIQNGGYNNTILVTEPYNSK
ncbi:MAG: biopolymer transporter ExbD [Alphaproteobacteria bacterium]|nr:biopolymer transporter ExbD [Rickettsiales bacterium]